MYTGAEYKPHARYVATVCIYIKYVIFSSPVKVAINLTCTKNIQSYKGMMRTRTHMHVYVYRNTNNEWEQKNLKKKKGPQGNVYYYI